MDNVGWENVLNFTLHSTEREEESGRRRKNIRQIEKSVGKVADFKEKRVLEKWIWRNNGDMGKLSLWPLDWSLSLQNTNN